MKMKINNLDEMTIGQQKSISLTSWFDDVYII